MSKYWYKGLGRVAREAVGAENVIEEPGAGTRGHGGMDVIESIIIHHTAGAWDKTRPADYNSRSTVLHGHPGAKGPLAHYGVGRVTGRVYWFASGLCAHAGRDSLVLGRKHRNIRAIGIEIENNGLGEPYAPATYNAAVALAGQLVIEFGLQVSDVVGHKEIALTESGRLGRKTDPSFDMHKFRRDVSAWIERKRTGQALPVAVQKTPETNTNTNKETEADMALSQEQYDAIMRELSTIKKSTSTTVVNTFTYGGVEKPATVAGALTDAHTRLRNIEAKIDGNKGEAEEIKRILINVQEIVAVLDEKVDALEATEG